MGWVGAVLESGRQSHRGFGEKGKYVQTAAFKVQSSSWKPNIKSMINWVKKRAAAPSRED